MNFAPPSNIGNKIAKTGDMPTDGVMKWKTINTDLSGEPAGSRTIEITYDFPAGTGDGGNYDSTFRTAYLPATTSGITALKMLKLGFERRFNFGLGISATT